MPTECLENVFSPAILQPFSSHYQVFVLKKCLEISSHSPAKISRHSPAILQQSPVILKRRVIGPIFSRHSPVILQTFSRHFSISCPFTCCDSFSVDTSIGAAARCNCFRDFRCYYNTLIEIKWCRRNLRRNGILFHWNPVILLCLLWIIVNERQKIDFAERKDAKGLFVITFTYLLLLRFINGYRFWFPYWP